ncbi:MAG TPA: LON peptidase substrate-binding domain-containing protein [Candidatus Sulfomarinibacteraceae bacterium]|nr:LON peptidase substrate-binding domain-containing protein [Candidatus Sulfomarinibacteraceae bacterium]
MEYELPLFPLNTVLFPGMPLTLHVFEERYKTMVNQCLGEGMPFGVVLIKEGVEADGPLAEPHPIGCTAEIAQVQPLLGERMNILVLGGERFRIVSLEPQQNAGFLKGQVQNYPLEWLPMDDTAQASRQLRPWVREYLALLSDAGDVEFDFESLPDDAESLAFLAATVLQVPNSQKQELLAVPGIARLLSDIHTLYRRELPVLRQLLQRDDLVPAGPGPFSLS